LLTHPAPNFHLVLGTRVDPPLPLVTLRANNQMTEVRSQNLRFNQEETQKLFQKMIGISVDPVELDAINTQAEGWVTGLRLAALALQYRIGTGPIRGKLSVQNRFVTEYLFSEILAKRIRKLSNLVGIEYKSPHKFRHGHAVYALLQAQTMADYKAISQNLMHGSIKVTDSIYAWLNDNQVKDRIASLSTNQAQQPKNATELDILLSQLSKSELKQAIQLAADHLAGSL